MADPRLEARTWEAQQFLIKGERARGRTVGFKVQDKGGRGGGSRESSSRVFSEDASSARSRLAGNLVPPLAA